jgi:hypothetical protein
LKDLYESCKNGREIQQQDLAGLQQQLADYKRECERDIAQQKAAICWLKDMHVETPHIATLLGRTPTAHVQYYTGQTNRDLAGRVTNFFNEVKWETGTPKEVSATDFANSHSGKRIMVTYKNISIFHDPITVLESGDFFRPDQIARSVNKGDQATDLLITIFPTNFWK